MIFVHRIPGESLETVAARRMDLLNEAFADGLVLVTTAGSLEPAGVLIDTLVRYGNATAPILGGEADG